MLETAASWRFFLSRASSKIETAGGKRLGRERVTQMVRPSLADQDGVAAGTVGVIHGFFRDVEPEWVAISADGQALTVGSERLELVEDDELSPPA